MGPTGRSVAPLCIFVIHEDRCIDASLHWNLNVFKVLSYLFLRADMNIIAVSLRFSASRALPVYLFETDWWAAVLCRHYSLEAKIPAVLPYLSAEQNKKLWLMLIDKLYFRPGLASPVYKLSILLLVCLIENWNNNLCGSTFRNQLHCKCDTKYKLKNSV